MTNGLTKTTTGMILVLALFILSACGSTKKVVYFPNVKDGAIPTNNPFPEAVIQKNDILNITVSSLNAEASLVFNPTSGSAAGGGAAAAAPVGYLVNTEGNIQFPILGNLKAEGLTKGQLERNIVKTLMEKKLLLDPIVTVRFINFRVTVLGEVNHPTVVSVQNEKISLLEALGLAGDLTIYGKRDNIMIIREENNQRIIKRVNLNSDEVLTSPYYYLQSNDIVYVEPNKTKVASVSRGTQLLPIIFSGLSLILIAVQQLNNN